MKTLSLEGRAALVTGSSRGIGLAIAQGMREAGARVITHGLDENSPAELPDAPYLRGDLADSPDAPRALIEAAFKCEPTLDMLVSNAGGFFDVPFLQMTPERWEKTMNVNLRSGYFLIQAFAERLIQEKRGGAVVVTASTNGLQAERGSSAYDVSKGGLVMLTRSLSLDLADYGIRVNAIAPGLIRTPLTDPWISTRDTQRELYEKTIPAGRIGIAQECAGAAVFLASDAAAYVTGHILVIDGGLTASQIGRL